MKVIFLDFDGVINNWYHFNGMDPKNVEVLSKIIGATKAKVVVTSSLKYQLQQNQSIPFEKTEYYKYVTILRKYGINIYDVTPFVDGIRELEINAYLELHKEIEEYLILDDDYIIESHLDHQIFLELYKGLTTEHITPAINILNGKLGFYPTDFNFSETEEERLKRINEYYQSKKIL